MVNASSCRSACDAMQTVVRYWVGETDRQTDRDRGRETEREI